MKKLMTIITILGMILTMGSPIMNTMAAGSNDDYLELPDDLIPSD